MTAPRLKRQFIADLVPLVNRKAQDMVGYQLTDKALNFYEEIKKQPNWPVIRWLTHGEEHPVSKFRKPPQSYWMSAALMGLVFNCDAEGFSSETAESIALECDYVPKTIKRGLKLLIEDGLIYPITRNGTDGYLIAWNERRA